jgi:PAS domain S-box-containing protein
MDKESRPPCNRNSKTCSQERCEPKRSTAAQHVQLRGAMKRLTDRLQNSKEFAEEIVNTVREPLAVLTKDLKVLYVNSSFLKTFKVNRWETEGSLFYSLGNEQWNIPKLRGALEQVIAKDAPLLDFEVEHDFPSLGAKVMVLNARRIIHGHSDEPMMLLAIEDITERAQAERTRVQLAAIVEFSDDAMISKTLDGTITSWNKGAERLFGYTAKEAIGQNITLIIPPDRMQEEVMIIERLKRSERVEHFETLRMRKDGSLLDISLTISPLKDTVGRVIGASKVARDISERKRAEAERRFLKDRLAAELHDMAHLHELSMQLQSQQDIKRLLNKVLEGVITITGAEKGHVQLLDSQSGDLKIVVQMGFDRAFLDFFSRVQKSFAVTCGTALECNKRVIVEDVTKSPIFIGTPALDAILAGGVRAVQSTPLVDHEGRLLGILSTHYSAPHSPSERDLRILDLIARQAADLIERTQAEDALRESEAALRQKHAELQAHADELAHFNRLAVGRELRMIELKKEINEFCDQLGYARRYPLEFENEEQEPRD